MTRDIFSSQIIEHHRCFSSSLLIHLYMYILVLLTNTSFQDHLHYTLSCDAILHSHVGSYGVISGGVWETTGRDPLRIVELLHCLQHVGLDARSQPVLGPRAEAAGLQGCRATIGKLLCPHVSYIPRAFPKPPLLNNWLSLQALLRFGTSRFACATWC